MRAIDIETYRRILWLGFATGTLVLTSSVAASASGLLPPDRGALAAAGAAVLCCAAVFALVAPLRGAFAEPVGIPATHWVLPWVLCWLGAAGAAQGTGLPGAPQLGAAVGVVWALATAARFARRGDRVRIYVAAAYALQCVSLPLAALAGAR